MGGLFLKCDSTKLMGTADLRFEVTNVLISFSLTPQECGNLITIKFPTAKMTDLFLHHALAQNRNRTFRP